MRKLTDHKVNPTNDRLEISVLDEPGAGGANHHYKIAWGAEKPPSERPTIDELEQILTSGEPQVSVNPDGSIGVYDKCDIRFQNGPINENGVNGVTQEALLAIVADRLRSFQAGPYSCRENAVALTHIETAQLWLHKRTLERMQRGVEGTNQK